MKCLHCGTELDRLTKWRGPSEFCSDECKKANQDEFNRLAMSRLMQPRPARTSARAAASPVRTVESGAGRLTVVTHPVGASRPILTEPPEAGFIFQAEAILSELQLRHPPAAAIHALAPAIPNSEITTGNTLRALQAILAGIRPQVRPSRPLPGALGYRIVPAPGDPPVPDLPESEPIWAASLGLKFTVTGTAGLPLGERRAGSEAPPAISVTRVSEPVAHRAIPSRRPARALPIAVRYEPGTDQMLPPPAVSPPRLRIHLPKPVLQPFRPRYAFAPAPSDTASPAKPPAPAVVVEVEKPAAINPAPAKARAGQAKKQAPGLNLRPGAEGLDLSLPVEPPQTETAPAPAAPFAVPSFGGQSEPEPEGFWSRIPAWVKVIAALAILGIAAAAWAIPALKSRNSGAGNWETNPTQDTAGIARRRVVTQYKPARAKSDYVFEFTGQIEQRAMGWVFRMKDPRNYYCLKLEKPGAAAQLVKFAVVDGDEQPHRLVELREPIRDGAPVKIRLEVRGHSFSTEINGKPADVWIDNQLVSGTVGFSNESGERAVIRNVKVSY